MVYSAFRDGNVPANYELPGPFEQSLELIPQGVKKVFFACGYGREC